MENRVKYITQYNLGRYHSDGEFRERFIGYVRKYQQTLKGKISQEKSRKKMKESGYIRDYCRQRRKDARDKGICQRCLAQEIIPGKTICKACSDRIKRQYHERKRILSMA